MGIFNFKRKHNGLETLALLALSKKSTLSDIVQDMFGSSSGAPVIRTESDELNSYNGQLPWVSIAVDCITRDIASQEYFFTDLNGKIIDDRRVPDEIKMPFENGWNGLSFTQMLKFIVPSRLLTGNSYLWRVSATAWGLSRDVQDTFIPLSAEQVKIRLKYNYLGVDHYQVTLGDGSQFEVAPDDIIHLRQNATINPFIGIGNIGKMRLLVEGEISAAQYINSFLVDSMKMPLMSMIETGSRTDEESRRTRDILKSKFSSRFAYFNGEGISLTQSSLLQKDVEFLQLRRDDRQAQLSMFGVPPVVAGIPDDSNRATSGNQFVGYFKSTINPILRELADDFTRQHVWRYNKNIKFQFRMHSVGDVDTLIKQVQAGIISPNRASEMSGEEFDLLDESRNTFYMPANLIPIGSEPTPAQVVPPEEKKSLDLSNPKNIDEICEKFLKSATNPKRFQVKYIRAAFKSRNAIEDKFVGKLSAFFESQKKRVLMKLEAQSKAIKATSVELIFDFDEESALMREEMKGLYTSGVQRSIADVNAITNSRVNLNTSNPFVAASINKLGDRITGHRDRSGNLISVSDTTRDALQKLLTNSVNENWNINQLQDEIQGKFDQWQGYRARMIARTESRAAWDAGAKVAYQEIGVEKVDIVGCTQFESDSDCGAQGKLVSEIDSLIFHPNHIGCPAPSAEI